MAEDVPTGMSTLSLERQDEYQAAINVPYGVTPFGRGPFLKCKERKVSRNHGLLELLPDGQCFITSTHTTPVFLRPGGKGQPRTLVKDERHPLHVGDEFLLLPDSHCYRLCGPPDRPAGGSAASAELARFAPTAAADRRPADGGPAAAEGSGPVASPAAAPAALIPASPPGGRAVESGSPASGPGTEERGPQSGPGTEGRGPQAGPGTEERGPNIGPEAEGRGPQAGPGNEGRGPQAGPGAERRGPGAGPGTEGQGPDASPGAEGFRPAVGPGTESEAAAGGRSVEPAMSSEGGCRSAGNTSNGRALTASVAAAEKSRGEGVLPRKTHAPSTEATVNGSARKTRKLPAWLLNPDAVPDSASGGGQKKRASPNGTTSPRGGKRAAPAGSASGGGQRKQAATSAGGERGARGAARAAGSPRGQKRGRPLPSELSDSEDEVLPGGARPRPAGEELDVANAPAAPAAAATTAARPADPPPPQTATGRTVADAAAAASAFGGGAATSSAPSAPQMAAPSRGGARDMSDSEDGEEAKPAGTTASDSQRESCGFGSDCFRKNPAHRLELAHPGDADYQAPPDAAAAGPLPECEFGRNCYRKNPQHRKMFAHTSRPNPGREAKRKARRRAQQPADSYDLDDEFIDDGDSDEYAPDDSGSDWSADEGSGSDDDDRRRRVKEARRLTGGVR